MAYVLLVDDSELILQMLEMVVAQAGHRVATAASWAVAAERYAAEAPGVVVTDLNLPDQEDPIGAFQALGGVPIIVVSGRAQAELDRIVADRGVAGALSKDAGMLGMATVLPGLIAQAAG